MPIIIRDIDLTLAAEQTLRRQGLGKPGTKLQAGMDARLQELLDIVHKDQLLKPAIIYELYPVINISKGKVYLSADYTSMIRSSFITSHFPSVKELAIVICTIGRKLEARVADFFQHDMPLLGLFLDGIGNAAVDLLAEKACQIVHDESALRGYQSGSPLSPGMPGLSINEQKNLFRLVPTNEIDVKLTSGGTMVPRKSLSMIICIGYEMAQWTKDKVCKRCSLRKTCQYKVQSVFH